MKKMLGLLLVLLMGTAFADDTVTFTTPTTRADGSAITGPLTYKLYGALQGQAKTVLATGAASPLVNTAPVGGQTWCYEVTANETMAGVSRESARSSQACKTTPVAPPNPPTNVVVALIFDTSPAFRVVSGARSQALAGLVKAGRPCSGAPIFTYRGSAFKAVSWADVERWPGTNASGVVAAACN